MPPAGLPLCGSGARRLHGEGRHRPLRRGLRRGREAADPRGGGCEPSVAPAGRALRVGNDRGRLYGRERRRGGQRLSPAEAAAGGGAAAGIGRPGPFLGLPEPGAAAAGRRAGGRYRPIGLPDRRGPPSRRPAGPRLGRQRAALAPSLSGPRCDPLARRHGPVPDDGEGPPEGQGRSPAGEPLHDGPGRRPRDRSPPLRGRGHAALRPARRGRRHSSRLSPRPAPETRCGRRRLSRHPRTDRRLHRAGGSRGARGRAVAPRLGARDRAFGARPRGRGDRQRRLGHGVRLRLALDRRTGGLRCLGRAGTRPRRDAGAGLELRGPSWLNTWGSGRFSGIAEDAGHVVERLVERTFPAEVRGLRMAAGCG